MGNKDDLHWCFNPFKIDETTVYYKNFFFLVWGLGLPILLILSLGYGSYLESGPLEFSWHEKGYEHFYNFYRFPILLLPTIGILGVTIARMHASKVRERSLRIAEAKNDFDRRFKHEEEFLKYLKNSVNTSTSRFSSLEAVFPQIEISHTVYAAYFPTNKTSADRIFADTRHAQMQVEYLCQSIDAKLYGINDHSDVTRELLESLTKLINYRINIKFYFSSDNGDGPINYAYSPNNILEFSSMLSDALLLYWSPVVFMRPILQDDRIENPQIIEMPNLIRLKAQCEIELESEKALSSRVHNRNRFS